MFPNVVVINLHVQLSLFKRAFNTLAKNTMGVELVRDRGSFLEKRILFIWKQ